MRTLPVVFAIALGGTAASAQMFPKPAPELDAMAKLMLGTWACDSTAKVGKNEQKYTLKITWTRELGGFWLVGRSEASVQGMKLESVSYLGYDAGTKTWMQVGVDSEGSLVSLTAKGGPDKLEFTGKARAMGQEMSPTMTMVKKGDREVVLTSSATMGGQAMTEEMVCKK
ncbi:MAG TPA: DUF1579 family protein [Haliangiales bacterium]|nr:DUF1579 family protein [Haliangiales bacterium]